MLRWKAVLWKECGADSLFLRLSAIVKINARIGRTCDMYEQNNVTLHYAERQRTRFPLLLCKAASFRLCVNVLTDRNFSNEAESYLSLDP